MKADFTRLTFKREKHYNGVRMQQGRVQVDADWNEQVDILAHLRNTQSTDVIGACGAPRVDAGFKIEKLGDGEDLSISSGRIYVDGLLCELEEAPLVDVTELNEENKTLHIPFLSANGKKLFEENQWITVLAEGVESKIIQITKIEKKTNNEAVYFKITVDSNADLSEFQDAEGLRIRQIESYTTQTNFPAAGLPTNVGLHLAYLDVWERHITAVEDPAIREVALNGPDTATRTQTVWQVKLMQVPDKNFKDADLTCWDVPNQDQWTDLVQKSKGFLSARAASSESESRPCIMPAGAGYRRLENQLYRVEIHKPGPMGTATFKWSRDNGIVLSRVQEIIPDQYQLVVSDVGKDNNLRFGPGQWVEVTDEDRVLRGEPGFLFKVKTVEENTLVLDITAPESGETPTPEYVAWENYVEPLTSTLATNRVTARRWDQSGTGATVNGVQVPSDGAWVALEDGGAQVRFDGGGDYVTGDYWLIPARTVGGDVEWPRYDDDPLQPMPQPPHGIQHHYCRLALVKINASGSETPLEVVDDCRLLFPALNEPDLVYVSGDGQEAMPGDHLPQPLRVCVYNCNEPVEGAWIKFEILQEGTEGNGSLTPKADAVVAYSGGTGGKTKWFIVATDENGEAECTWHLRDDIDLKPEPSELPAQQVRATLLGDANNSDSKLDRPVVFSASFGVAWEDRYAGSVFPDEQYPDPGNDERPSLVVHTVEDAIDQLRQNVALFYVSGDGQEARRLYVLEEDEWVLKREQLKQPLVVRAANGDWPFGNAEVKFRITGGNGSIQPAADYEIVGTPVTQDGRTIEFVVKTKADGLAECLWELDEEPDSTTVGQQVTATLENTLPAGTDNFVVFPSEVRFNASLSIAEEVTYDGSHFPDDQHSDLIVHTVEDAIDQLRQNVALYYVSGDGQEIMRRRGDGETRESLPRPLQVRVANGDWPFKGAKVNFAVTIGSGTVATTKDTVGSDNITVETNEEGLAQCYWLMDEDTWSQQVTATLESTLPVGTDNFKVFKSEVRFNASLSVAEEVSYDPNEESSEGVSTVQAALDDLYATKVDRAGDTITGSLTIQGNLTVNGTQVIANTERVDVEDNIIRVNRYTYSGPPTGINLNAGLEVYRGETVLPPGRPIETPTAQILWDETVDHWKIGIKGSLVDIAYGPNWDTLTNGSIADGLHKHAKLYTPTGSLALSVDDGGKVGIGTENPYTKLHIVTSTGTGTTDPNYGNPWLWGKHIEIAASQMWGLTDLHGMLCTWNSDSLFIGQKNEGEDRKDAIIAFGDNSNDSLRIIFTPYNPATPPQELMRIAGDGKVGIGKQPEEEKLEVNGNVKATAFIGDGSRLTGVGGGQWADGAGGAIYYNGGSVGIGTVTPNPFNENITSLYIKGNASTIELDSTGSTKRWRIVSALNGRLYFHQFAEGQMGAEKSSVLVLEHVTGYVGINQNDPQATLDVNGEAIKPGGGPWGTPSDKRLKKNVRPLKGVLDQMLQLRGVSYEWKEPEKFGNLTGRQMGFIADEVEEVFPEWIGVSRNGYKNLSIRGFESLTVEAFRELHAATEDLKARNKDLEKKIEVLERRLEREGEIKRVEEKTKAPEQELKKKAGTKELEVKVEAPVKQPGKKAVIKKHEKKAKGLEKKKEK